MPRDSASVRACGLIACAARMPRQPSQLDSLEITRELLDRVDRADALDLDGHPVTALVAAHEIDRADVGGPFPPDEPKLRAENVRPRRKLFLQVPLDAVLLERR